MSIKVRFVILGWSRYREIYLKTRQPDYFGFVSLIKQQLSTEEHKSITSVTQLTPKTTQALITLSYKFSMCKTHAYCHLCLAYVPIADFLALIPAVKIANLWAFSVGLLQLTPQHLHLEHWGCTQGSRTHLLLSKHNVTTELTQQPWTQLAPMLGARLPWFPGDVWRGHFGALWLPQCSLFLSPRMWRKKLFNTHFTILTSFLPSPLNVE